MVRCILPLPFALLLASLLLGCGGTVQRSTAGDDGGSGGSDDGGAIDASGSHDTGAIGVDGGVCIDIDPSTFDQSCQSDSDCVPITSGPLCDGYTCTCPGGGAINASAEASYQALVSSIHPGKGPLCECPAFPGPQCLGGVCTVCSGLEGDPPACHSTPPDAGADGSACVDVDLATYDRSCQYSADCIGITPGVLCPGSCTCGGAAVNVSEQLRYQNTILQLGTSTECPCVAGPAVACIQNECSLCGFGNLPECPDGGG